MTGGTRPKMAVWMFRSVIGSTAPKDPRRNTESRPFTTVARFSPRACPFSVPVSIQFSGAGSSRTATRVAERILSRYRRVPGLRALAGPRPRGGCRAGAAVRGGVTRRFLPPSLPSLRAEREAVSCHLLHLRPAVRQREVLALRPQRRDVGVVRARWLTGLPRRARGQGAIPVGEVDEVAVTRPVRLVEVVVVSRVVRRVRVAGPLEWSDVKRLRDPGVERRERVLEGRGVQRAPPLLLCLRELLQLLDRSGKRRAQKPVAAGLGVHSEPFLIRVLQHLEHVRQSAERDE